MLFGLNDSEACCFECGGDLLITGSCRAGCDGAKTPHAVDPTGQLILPFPNFVYTQSSLMI